MVFSLINILNFRHFLTGHALGDSWGGLKEEEIFTKNSSSFSSLNYVVGKDHARGVITQFCLKLALGKMSPPGLFLRLQEA